MEPKEDLAIDVNKQLSLSLWSRLADCLWVNFREFVKPEKTNIKCSILVA